MTLIVTPQVVSITGTANQITASSPNGAVTLSTPNPTYAIVEATSAQTFTNGVQANVLFDADVSDPFTLHSTSSNTDRINIPDNGLYLLCVSIPWDNMAANGRLFARIITNTGAVLGSFDSYYTGSVQTYPSLAFSAVAKLTAGQYVVVAAYQVTGGNYATLPSGGVNPTFSITFLGTA